VALVVGALELDPEPGAVAVRDEGAAGRRERAVEQQRLDADAWARFRFAMA